MASAPDITFRNYTTPYSVTALIIYSQTSPGGSGLPVLQGTDSDPLYFRIYNNFALNSDIASAVNFFVTTYDGMGVMSHTAAKAVVSQHWIHALENGYGEGSVTPGVYTVFAGSDTMIGGAFQYILDKGSDGGSSSIIRAGSNGSGCGFAEIKSYARVPADAQNGTTTFAISAGYEWVS